MTFEELYPNQKPTDLDIEIEGDCVFVYSLAHEAIKPCVISECGRPTRWISLSLGSHYCSAECLREEWEQYFRALAEPPNAQQWPAEALDRIEADLLESLRLARLTADALIAEIIEKHPALIDNQHAVELMNRVRPQWTESYDGEPKK